MHSDSVLTTMHVQEFMFISVPTYSCSFSPVPAGTGKCPLSLFILIFVERDSRQKKYPQKTENARRVSIPYDTERRGMVGNDDLVWIRSRLKGSHGS